MEAIDVRIEQIQKPREQKKLGATLSMLARDQLEKLRDKLDQATAKGITG